MDARLFTIDVNGKVQFRVDGAKPLLYALADNGILVPTVCGGKAICGQCKVKVLEGGGAMLPAEEKLLSDAERADNIRLSCQVQVESNLKIQVPEELLGVREYIGVCSKIEELTYDTRRFRFELKEPGSIDFVPGQNFQTQEIPVSFRIVIAYQIMGF